MALSPTDFPLNGVIGIVDASRQQLEQACQLNLTSVEIRADLLRSAGLSDRELMSVVADAKTAGLACLFTLRHADQGGTFNSQEKDRINMCSQALDAGADIIDLEHGTEAASTMLAMSAPMILSHHNFDRMLDADELIGLSAAMEAQTPAAVKIIPTGQSVADAATMLAWVSKGGNRVRRIGFSMGADGAISRILALSCGSPVTYASFGEPVAPGQIDIHLLLNRYRCMGMSMSTRVTALFGDPDKGEAYAANNAAGKSSDVFVVVAAADEKLVERHQHDLNIANIVRL